MQQSLILTPSDRATIETSLARLIGNSWGAMATIPLYCVGEFNAPDAEMMVHERYDIWHSCLVVAREMLRSSLLIESVNSPMDALFSATSEDLRDEFVKLMRSRDMSRDEVKRAYGRLAAAYEQLSISILEIGHALELSPELVPARNSLKWVVFERSMKWFGEELGALPG